MEIPNRDHALCPGQAELTLGLGELMEHGARPRLARPRSSRSTWRCGTRALGRLRIRSRRWFGRRLFTSKGREEKEGREKKVYPNKKLAPVHHDRKLHVEAAHVNLHERTPTAHFVHGAPHRAHNALFQGAHPLIFILPKSPAHGALEH